MDNKRKILDIAMNLNRIGNWAADDFNAKKKRINLFLDQTTQYLSDLSSNDFPEPLKKTFDKFLPQFKNLEKAAKKEEVDIAWAEKMMTWGNILTHRASLLK